MGFTTNRDQVKSQVQGGGWVVAYGRELTYQDAAEGTIAAGVSIFTDEPGPILAWLDALITESLDQMEASIVATFTPVARQTAEQFAKGVITSLLQGRSAGEKFTNLFHFNFKAGVAQFNGQNTQWVPNISTGALGSLITSGDTGGHDENVGPPVISYCPYVGLRFNPSVGAPPTTIQRLQWVGVTGEWYNRHQPGVWHEFVGIQPPQFRKAFSETGRDATFVYLRDQTPGSHLELALGFSQQF